MANKKLRFITVVSLLGMLASCVAPSYPVRTTLEEAGKIIGTTLPAPSHFPQGYELSQIDVVSKDTAVLCISISSKPTEASDTTYEIEMRIQWWSSGFIPGGLKIPGERVSIGDTVGVLWDKGESYSLLWQPFDATQQGQFDLSLSANKSIPEEELLKIARSVHQ